MTISGLVDKRGSLAYTLTNGLTDLVWYQQWSYVEDGGIV